MIIETDVHVICAGYTPAQSFAQLVQSIITAEGNILKAVQCSDSTVTTREQAIHVVCRSIIHRQNDYLLKFYPLAFSMYMGSFWAPIGAANDPTNLNKNWASNVAKLWES